MNDNELDAKQIEKRVSDLADAMERVRDDQATRDDVVVEMKQAARARLELLAQDLQPIFNEVPDDNDQFEFALTSGETPRLWIDMTSFVRMGRDRRVYEFVKDTRLGRTIMAHSDQRDTMKEAVTRYIAERMLLKERMIEGEWQSVQSMNFGEGTGTDTEESEDTPPQGRSAGSLLAVFLFGLAGGAGGVLAWAWNDDIPEVINRILQNIPL